MADQAVAEAPYGGAQAPSSLPPRRLLQFEVLVVVAVGILPATAGAILSLVSSLLTHSRNNLHVVRIPGHPLVDNALQILNLAVQTSAVLLVAYVLLRSGESLAAIGLNRKRLGKDLGLAALLFVGLVVLAGITGVAVQLFHIPGLTNQVGPGITAAYIPTFLVAAVRAGFLEEIIVCGFLLHRLRQLGWSDRKALTASTLLRASYHVYGGLPLLILVLPMGLVFGRIYQRSQRLLALVLGHALYDGILYTLYIANR